MRNDYRNAKLHLQMTFSLSLTLEIEATQNKQNIQIKIHYLLCHDNFA